MNDDRYEGQFVNGNLEGRENIFIVMEICTMENGAMIKKMELENIL